MQMIIPFSGFSPVVIQLTIKLYFTPLKLKETNHEFRLMLTLLDP